MQSTRYLTTVTASGLIVLSLAACQTTRLSGGPAAGGMSPADEKSPRTPPALVEAVRGLGFETGSVVLEPALRRLESSDPALAQRMIEDAEAQLQVNHRIGAVTSYAEAVRAAPDLVEAYFGLGRALAIYGKTEWAIASFRTVIQMAPQHLEGRVALANALASAAYRDEAISEMEAALEIDDEHGPAHERLAVWYYYNEDYTAAWEHVQAARRLAQPLAPQFIKLLESQMPEPSG